MLKQGFCHYKSNVFKALSVSARPETVLKQPETFGLLRGTMKTRLKPFAAS
jgi:hypothetical protein